MNKNTSDTKMKIPANDQMKYFISTLCRFGTYFLMYPSIGILPSVNKHTIILKDKFQFVIKSEKQLAMLNKCKTISNKRDGVPNAN